MDLRLGVGRVGPAGRQGSACPLPHRSAGDRPPCLADDVRGRAGRGPRRCQVESKKGGAACVPRRGDWPPATPPDSSTGARPEAGRCAAGPSAATRPAIDLEPEASSPKLMLLYVGQIGPDQNLLRLVEGEFGSDQTVLRQKLLVTEREAEVLFMDRARQVEPRHRGDPQPQPAHGEQAPSSRSAPSSVWRTASPRPRWRCAPWG